MADVLNQEIRAKVLPRKDELMASSASDLRALPPYTGELFSAVGKLVELGIWHERTPDGEDIVVVQCKRGVLLGFGNMFAEGFVVDSEGHIRDVEPDVMWRYK
jgi:hypothetical protein